MKLLICYKNFASTASHIGLGVAALNTAKVLNAHGVDTIVRAVNSIKDIINIVEQFPELEDIVISAPWIQVPDLVTLINWYPNISFAINCHSNVGFLQADTRGIELIRSYIDLEQGSLNFKVSANSKRGTRWLRSAYQCPCVYLPNLYYLDYSIDVTRPLWNGGVLKIGSFGANRPLKNQISACGAALVIKNTLKAQQTEFWINFGRTDGGEGTVSSIKSMLRGVPGIELKQVTWQSWPQFRDTVREMNLLLQVSYTESFSMVTADGIAEGVPSVTSDAIDWTPQYWQSDSDDVREISRIGLDLLRNPNAPKDGLVHLEQHNKDGFGAWCEWLGIEKKYDSLSNDPFLI